jgi:chromosome segregation ATPase
MGNHFENRLSELRSQYETGQRELEKLQQRQNDLQATLLRISGAVQVLEEELSKEKQSEKGQQQ